MDRRKFIQNSALTGLALALSQYSCASKETVTTEATKTAEKIIQPKENPIGLQLYTVRDDMDKDAIGTLKRLSKIGYNRIESAGYKEGKYYGIPAKEFRKVLDGEGLTITSGHTQTGAHTPDQKGLILNDFESHVADAAAIGQEYIVCGYLHDFERKSIDQYKKLAEDFNKAGELCNQYGIKFGYHNHDFEFFDLDGEIPYDVLLSEIDAKNMIMELDLYWIRKANKDFGTYFKNHAGRFELWHVKDMADTEDQFFTEVGNGVIDWSAVFAQAELSGMKHYYVEQDQCKNHQPLESVAISYKYLRELGV